MAKLRRILEILLICICLTIASTEIIQKRQHLLDDIRCHFRKLIIFDKFNKGNSDKLILCEKLLDAKKSPRTYKTIKLEIDYYNLNFYFIYSTFKSC